jgi:hypothetical protein
VTTLSELDVAIANGAPQKFTDVSEERVVSIFRIEDTLGKRASSDFSFQLV